MMQPLRGFAFASKDGLKPTEEAETTARLMLSDRENQRNILRESAATGNESGLTYCAPADSGGPQGGTRDATPGSQGEEMTTYEPPSAQPRQIELRACPRGGGGMIHTHPTGAASFRDPILSLPDMMHVLTDDGSSATMVLGTNTSEVMLEPTEKTEPLLFLSNLLDVDEPLRSAGDADRARRRLSQDEIVKAHRAMRKEFPDLFVRKPTGHNIALSAAPGASARAALQDSNRSAQQLAYAAHATLQGRSITFNPGDVNINLAQELAKHTVDAVITALVLLVFAGLLGGTPRQLASEFAVGS